MDNLEEKRFLVAIPKGKLLSVAEAIQIELNNKFSIYDSKLPPLHVTIEHIRVTRDEDLKEAANIIDGVCERHAPFELRINGFSFFGPPYKSINLHVEKTNALARISREIHKHLQQKGLSSRPFREEWEFHISLINTVFANREWTEAEFKDAKELVMKWHVNMTSQVEYLELWRPKFKPNLEVDRVFLLRGMNRECDQL